MATASAAFTFDGAAGSLLVLETTDGATVTAELDSLDGVSTVAWSVYSTDETTDVGDYALTTSGPKGSIVTFAAGTAGTAGLLQCRVNGGINPQTGATEAAYTKRAKWHVPTDGGLEVGCVDEAFESDPIFGTTGIVNAAVRSVGAGSSVTSVTGTAPIVSSGGATPAISISAANGSGPGSMSVDHYTLCAGATSAATVSTIAKRDADGRMKAVAGVASDDVAVVSQLGGTSWRVAPDAHDLGVWRMDEASSNFANTGTDGALALTPTGLVSLDYARQGPLVTCASFRGTNYAIGPNATGLCQPASALTVWAWVLLTGHASGLGPLFAAKLHDTPTTWSAPYEDWAIWGADSGSPDRAWYVGVNIGGSLVSLTLGVDGYGVADRAALTLGVPHLVGLTHDGTTLRAYLDGALVGSTSASGSVSYGDGPIVRGGNPSYSGHGGNLYLGEMRIADVARSAAYFAEVYQSFMRRWP